MAFTPNMSPAQIAEHDRKRKENPDLLYDQGPSVADNDVKELRRGRKETMPIPPKREGETNLQRYIRHYSDEVKENPDKYPGGRKQAIAIGYSEAGEAKKSDSPLDDKMESLKKWVKKGPPPIPGAGIVSSAPRPAGPTASVPKPKAPSNPYRPPGLSPSIKNVEGGADDEDEEFADNIFGKNVPMAAAPATPTPPPAGMGASTGSPGMAAANSALSTMKSLNSGSMHVFRPVGNWDPYGVNRSATTIPVHSAPIAEQQTTAKPDVWKSCVAHGVNYRAGGQCEPCRIAKSTECVTCGAGMSKSFGGVYRCPRGH